MTVNELKDILVNEFEVDKRKLNNKNKVQLNEMLEKCEADRERELEEKRRQEQLKKESEEEVEKVADEIEPKVMEKPAPPKKINLDEQIQVMNGTSGQLIYQSRNSGQRWEFTSYGDIDYINFGELQRMKSSNPSFINDAWLIILDDDAVNALGIAKMYENVMQPQDLNRFFMLSDKRIKERLINTPKGIKDLVFRVARDKVNDGSLDSVRKIKVIEEIFGRKLSEE